MATAGAVLFKRGEQNSSDFDDIWDDTALIEAYDRAVGIAKDVIKQRQKNSLSGSVSESSSNAVTQKYNKNRRRRKGNNKEKQWNSWHQGDHCRAAYSVDGITYEAEVQSINYDEGKCVVQFVGYGNSEEAMLKQLMPTNGPQARLMQIAESQGNLDDCITKEAQPKLKRGSRHNSIHNAEQNHSHCQNGPKAEKQQKPSSYYSRQYSPHMPGMPSTSNQSFFMQAPPFSFQPWATSPPASIPPMVLPPPPLPISEDPEEDDEALSSMLMAWYMSGYHTGYYQGLKCGRSRAAAPCYTPRESRRQSPVCAHKCSKLHR